MPPAHKKGEHCRDQAAECATAATVATLADVREAYLNLEQGWIELASEFDEMPELPVTSSAGGNRSQQISTPVRRASRMRR
jgi:hypothetical protein